MTDNMRGALFMSLSMAGFSINDALIKLVTTQVPLFQAILLRGLFSAVLMLGIVIWSRAPRPQIQWSDGRWLGCRLIGEIGGTVCFLTALVHLPLANATAILQAMPLVVTLGAALFLGERVGWRRYTAILVGFGGVLLIVKPGHDAFSVYTFYAIGAVILFSLRDLATRQVSARIHSATITLITTVAITLTGAVGSLAGPWISVAPLEIMLLMACAVFVAVGYFCGIAAMRVGQVGAVSPFRYAILLWAILLGILIFGDWPDQSMLLGALILATSGLYTLRRQRPPKPVAR